MDFFERLHKLAGDFGVDRRVMDLAEIVYHDSPKAVERAYLFAETIDNQESVFGAAKRMKGEGLAQTFLIIGKEDEGTGFPGFSHWKAMLEGYNVDAVPFMPIESRTTVDTQTEARSLVEYL